MQIQISWLLQLIWIYTVCKGKTYPGSAGQGLSNGQGTNKCLIKTCDSSREFDGQQNVDIVLFLLLLFHDLEGTTAFIRFILCIFS